MIAFVLPCREYNIFRSLDRDYVLSCLRDYFLIWAKLKYKNQNNAAATAKVRLFVIVRVLENMLDAISFIKRYPSLHCSIIDF